MLNSVVIIGRLVADPEHRETNTGKGVANMRIAVDRKGREKETDFFSVTAWGQTADFVCTYLQKGRLVAVQGRLQVRSYKDKEDVQRQSYEIVADSVQPLDSRKDGVGGVVASTTGKDDEISDPFAD
jgi:single-strand DNA-binding protein